MSIETKHGEHTIAYSENEDIWRCWDMNVEGKTLSAVKQKLNKIDAENRRVASVPVVIVSDWGSGVEGTGVVTLRDGERAAWTMVSKKHYAKPRREKVRLASMVLDTPENRAKLNEYTALRKIASDASKAASAHLEAIPRVTDADLAGLAEDTDAA